MKKGVYLFLLFVVSGCVSHVYDVDSELVGKPLEIPNSDYKYDFRQGYIMMAGSRVNIEDVSTTLAYYGIRVAYGQGFEPAELNIDGDYSIIEVMRILEIAFDCKAEKSGGLWVLNKNGKDEDSSSPLNHSGGGSDKQSLYGSYVYYFRVWGFSNDEIQQRLSGYGVLQLGNSVYYARSDLKSIIDLDDIVTNMLRCVPVQYYFNVFFVSDDILRDIGLDVHPSVGGLVSRLWSKGVASTYDYRAALDVALDSSFDLSSKKGVRRMGGVVREGSEFVFRIGDEIPIAKKAVSDAGTVTDTGYEYQRFGLQVKVKVEGRSFGVLVLGIENTDIGGYVGGYPVRHGSVLDTTMVIGSNDRLYVGSAYMDSRTLTLLGYKYQRQYYHILIECDVVEAGQRVVFRQK